MAKEPTPQQIEAYRLVHIHQCNQFEAATIMGCRQSNISQLLKKLKKIKPHLFIKKQRFKIFSLNEVLDSKPIMKF